MSLMNRIINSDQLIQRKPANRLGLNGPAEIKSHPWIKDYPWNKLANREIDPPFVPNVNNDLRNFKN